MRRFLAVVVLAAVVAIPAAAQVSTWEVDPVHSSAGFSVRHLMISNVKGEFTKISGKLLLDDNDITKSSVEVTIDAGTIDTREPQRDNHLKSADFLDVATHSTMTFKSKSVAKAGDKLKVTGDLTIRGVTKEVVLDVTLSPEVKAFGGTRRGASATTVINRQDFDVKWNRALDGGGVVVGDTVNISIEVELNKKS